MGETKPLTDEPKRKETTDIVTSSKSGPSVVSDGEISDSEKRVDYGKEKSDHIGGVKLVSHVKSKDKPQSDEKSNAEEHKRKEKHRHDKHNSEEERRNFKKKRKNDRKKKKNKERKGLNVNYEEIEHAMGTRSSRSDRSNKRRKSTAKKGSLSSTQSSQERNSCEKLSNEKTTSGEKTNSMEMINRKRSIVEKHKSSRRDTTTSVSETSTHQPAVAEDMIRIDLMEKERTRDVCCQSFVPFVIAGMGSIGAGQVLHVAQKTLLLMKVRQFLAISPPLQGMKGNLDMTFTSRLTTMAHQGRLDPGSGRIYTVLRNMALIQGQCVVISVVATLVSFCMDISKRYHYNCEPAVREFLLLGATAVMAMAGACAVMSMVMVCLVLYCRAHDLNPDNVATPLAASAGDLLTISVMLGLGTLLYMMGGMEFGVSIPILALGTCCAPIWLYVASFDKGALRAVKQQWIPLFIAVLLSSGAGYILENAARRYGDIVAFQPLITGIAGNRCAVHASRISSFLHVRKKSVHPLRLRLNPYAYYISDKRESRAARLLLFTALPYQLIFVFVAHGVSHMGSHPLTLSALFVIGYLLTAFIQISMLIFLCQLVVYGLWRKGFDPDMHAIPLMTSLGDLTGTALIYLLFTILPQSSVKLVAESDMEAQLSNTTCSTV